MKHRMFLSNIVGVAWTTYLTYKADRKGYILEELDKVLEKEERSESDQINNKACIEKLEWLGDNTDDKLLYQDTLSLHSLYIRPDAAQAHIG